MLNFHSLLSYKSFKILTPALSGGFFFLLYFQTTAQIKFGLKVNQIITDEKKLLESFFFIQY